MPSLHSSVEAPVPPSGAPAPEVARPRTSVGKALAVLDCFAQGDEVLGVSELARRVAVAKSTAHRLCTLLVAAGYLERTAHEKYRLGVRLFELGSQVGFRLAIREAATRVLQELTAVTHETAVLAVLDGPDVLCVQKVESTRPPRVPVRLGRREAAVATATGRSLLAWSLAEVDHAAAVSVDPGDGEAGATWVTAPVRNHRGEVVAAVGVAGPAPRMAGRVDEVAGQVRRAAAAASAQLGWRPPA